MSAISPLRKAELPELPSSSNVVPSGQRKDDGGVGPGWWTIQRRYQEKLSPSCSSQCDLQAVLRNGDWSCVKLCGLHAKGVWIGVVGVREVRQNQAGDSGLRGDLAQPPHRCSGRHC